MAYLLPAGLGDTSPANLPPEAGLYACLFGSIISIMQLLRRASRPHVALFGRGPGSEFYGDSEGNSESEVIPIEINPIAS